MTSVALDVQPLTDALFSKGVITAPYPLDEFQPQQERAQVVEAYVRARPSAHDSLSKTVALSPHANSLANTTLSLAIYGT